VEELNDDCIRQAFKKWLLRPRQMENRISLYEPALKKEYPMLTLSSYLADCFAYIPNSGWSRESKRNGESGSGYVVCLGELGFSR